MPAAPYSKEEPFHISRIRVLEEFADDCRFAKILDALDEVEEYLESVSDLDYEPDHPAIAEELRFCKEVHECIDNTVERRRLRQQTGVWIYGPDDFIPRSLRWWKKN